MGKKYRDLCSVYTKPFFICLALSFFAQAVGTSAFLYYGSEIFYETQADLDEIEEREESAIILDDFILGFFVLGNLISAFVIYKAGRKLMMLVSLPFAFISLLLLAYTMKEANYGDDDDSNERPKKHFKGDPQSKVHSRTALELTSPCDQDCKHYPVIVVNSERNYCRWCKFKKRKRKINLYCLQCTQQLNDKKRSGYVFLCGGECWENWHTFNRKSL